MASSYNRFVGLLKSKRAIYSNYFFAAIALFNFSVSSYETY